MRLTGQYANRRLLKCERTLHILSVKTNTD
jgi:hypothetical protein